MIKCWCGPLGKVPQPQLTSSHWLGHLPSFASPIALLLYKKKISGTVVRRTQDEMTDQSVTLMFVVVVILIIFLIFGQIHPLMFVVVVIFIIFLVMFKS